MALATLYYNYLSTCYIPFLICWFLIIDAVAKGLYFSKECSVTSNVPLTVHLCLFYKGMSLSFHAFIHIFCELLHCTSY